MSDQIKKWHKKFRENRNRRTNEQTNEQDHSYKKDLDKANVWRNDKISKIEKTSEKWNLRTSKREK